jgi:uncharacterized membrane protein YeaQ/YmgE (transglycosylase-associated protein family)
MPAWRLLALLRSEGPTLWIPATLGICPALHISIPMEMLAFIVIGLATGLLCRVILPNLRMGGLRMPLIGMVGGMFGGLVGGSLQQEKMAIAAPSLIGAFLGALLAVVVVTLLSRNRVHV